jgi:hypothetical protein
VWSYRRAFVHRINRVLQDNERAIVQSTPPGALAKLPTRAERLPSRGLIQRPGHIRSLGGVTWCGGVDCCEEGLEIDNYGTQGRQPFAH